MLFYRTSIYLQSIPFFDMTDHVQMNFIFNQCLQFCWTRNTFWCKNSFLGLHFDIVLGFPSEYIFRVMLLSNFQFHLSSHSMPWNLVFVFVVQISPNQVIVSNSFPFPWQYFSLLSCDTLCIRAAFILLSMTKSILLWMANAQYHIADNISK